MKLLKFLALFAATTQGCLIAPIIGIIGGIIGGIDNKIYISTLGNSTLGNSTSGNSTNENNQSRRRRNIDGTNQEKSFFTRV